MPKVLVIANETVDPAELRNRVLAGDARRDAELVVVSPARERLERSLAVLRDAGIEARGEVGDADPVIAISDGLQRFDADEIVLVGHRGPDADHTERGILERAKRRFSQPITELVVARDARPLD